MVVLTWHYRTKSILIIDIPVLRPSTLTPKYTKD